MKYGYLPAPDPSTGQLQAWTSVTSAVKAMQRFAGLKDTGVLGKRSVPLRHRLRVFSHCIPVSTSSFSDVQMRRHWC